MKRYAVIFHTDTKFNGMYECVEADNRGEVTTKLRDKYGKVYIDVCNELKDGDK